MRFVIAGSVIKDNIFCDNTICPFQSPRKRNRTKTTETDTIIVSSFHRRCSTREHSVLLVFYVSVFLPNSIDDFARRFEMCVAQWLDLFTATGTRRKRDTKENVFHIQTEHIRLARDWAIWWCGVRTHGSERNPRKSRDRQKKTTRFSCASGTQRNF